MIEFLNEYDPKLIEEKWYKFWLNEGFFNAEIRKDKKPYTIVIPPPNVTGVLHMGHGLNNTIQDILIRFKRMEGFEACWIPGTDHAGIATQNVVEKEILKNEGKTREQMGREEFLKRVWEWKEKNGSIIIEQLKKIGASCDWRRERFTMDEGLSNAVKEVFIRLYEDGLIYRGEYIINWCPRCTTALADDEVDYKETNGKLYYIKYPLKDSKNEFIIVATTRPETMLGDTAVAVNPADERYKNLIGRKVLLPLAQREIPIIADKRVDMEFGTGAVKVTPSHDPIDFEIGKEHKLQFIKIMDEKGFMNENVPLKYQKLDRYECRKSVIEDLKKENLIEKIEDYKHSVGHCYRCDTVIEPYQSTQWFVKMKPLAKEAIRVVQQGKIKFYPERWKKVYLNWMFNIKDWCISRQIWWGHRIPVYYCNDKLNDKCKKKDGIIVSREKPEICPYCGSKNISQDNDVLDTWFSSWLWPFSTMGWPSDTLELKYFFPTNVLVTDPGIIFFWVARMIMASLKFMKKIPFKDVHIHGVILDQFGRKMSKSLGNGIDPLEVVEKFGADALRYTIVSITPSGQNLLLSIDKFNAGRYFANKIFNAAKFVFMNYKNEKILPIEKLNLNLPDKWIISKLNRLIKDVTNSLNKYKFQEAAISLNNYIWHNLCDWYIEISKISIYKGNENERIKTFSVLFYVFKNVMKLLHPIMPFITEEIYQKLPNKDAKSIMISNWPIQNKNLIDKKSEKNMELIMNLISTIRSLRTLVKIPPDKMIELKVYTNDKEKLKIIKESEDYIKTLSKVEKVDYLSKLIELKNVVTGIVNKVEIFIPVLGIIDIEKEFNRLDKQVKEIKEEIKNLENKLSKKDFLEKAPKEVIAKNKEKLSQLKTNLKLYQLALKNIL